MIENIPSSNDFFSMGQEYIMMGYETLFMNYHTLNDPGDNFDEESKQNFWEDARSKFLIATTLVFQGIDFLLKSKIAEISPYILIAQDPDKIKIPKTNKIEFSDLYLHESSKLSKIYNIYAKDKLPDSFTDMFDDLRIIRNKTIHSIDIKFKPDIEKLISITIKLTVELSKKTWMNLRYKHGSKDPIFKILIGNEQDHRSTLLEELNYIKKVLDEKDFPLVFGAHKEEIKYICPNCFNKEHLNEPISSCTFDQAESNIYCIICNESFSISKKHHNCGCNLNFLINEHDICPLCGK